MDMAAMEKLRLPARMKGGGIKRATNARRPAFLGALLDIHPRCIDKKAENGKEMPGYYLEQLTKAIGKGTYDAEGHKTKHFLGAENIGPFPEATWEAWTKIGKEAMGNYGPVERSDQEEWGKLGPLAEATPANAKNRGASNKRRRRREEGRETERKWEGSRAREEQEGREEQGSREENEATETEELRRAMTEVIGEMEREEEQPKRETCREERGGMKNKGGHRRKRQGQGHRQITKTRKREKHKRQRKRQR
jgi:hypothetical protein